MQYNKIGQYIKSQRLALGKSLNEFAIENGVEPATLSRVENLKQSIKLITLYKIAKGFGKTPSEFLREFEKSSVC